MHAHPALLAITITFPNWVGVVLVACLSVVGLGLVRLRAAAARRELAGLKPAPERLRHLKATAQPRPTQPVEDADRQTAVPACSPPVAANPVRALTRTKDKPYIFNPSERRKALRREGSSISVTVTDAEASREPLEAMVVDRSTGGICLHLPEPVEEGTVLGVLPYNAPEGLPWIQVIVRNQRQQGDVWALGCQFVEELPLHVLLLFG